MVKQHTPLVPPHQLTAQRSYRQLSRSTEDERFRATLANLFPGDTFTSLCRTLAVDGATSLTGLLPPADFDRFRGTYDAEMLARGSRGSLHSYLNIASSAPLLRSPGMWETVAHPLVVALIAYALGGPVKIIDLRAKDTYPVDVVARDNTLHLDNSPFIDEYKLVATWTLGSTSGPAGQGLTYLPGTHHLFRDCFVAPDGTAWSDEDACIFPTEERVDDALSAQAGFLDGPGPRVVHLSDLERPCHTIFAASRLIHHRYRTSSGAARSSAMATFHRTDDGAELLEPTEQAPSPLHQFLVTGGSPQRFFDAVSGELPTIVATLCHVADLVVDPRRHTLTGQRLQEWHARQRAGVTLNDLRTRDMHNAPDTPVAWLVQRLRYDLQGPLNMPFFADLRETRRRRARIWLREMSPEGIRTAVTAACERVTDAAATTDLGADLADLNRLLSTSQTMPDGPRSTDWAAVRSLPAFVGDLRISVSWLESADRDSIITATAFAFLAAALSARCFALGDAGRQVTDRLLGQYLTVVRGAPGLPT